MPLGSLDEVDEEGAMISLKMALCATRNAKEATLLALSTMKPPKQVGASVRVCAVVEPDEAARCGGDAKCAARSWGCVWSWDAYLQIVCAGVGPRR